MVYGSWTMHHGLWTMDFGKWTMDCGLGHGLWTCTFWVWCGLSGWGVREWSELGSGGGCADWWVDPPACRQPVRPMLQLPESGRSNDIGIHS